MAISWDDLIPSTVFTRVKTNFSDSLKTKYKMTDKNFSTVGSSDTPAAFPFIGVQLISMNEISNDLDGDTIPAVMCGFQIDVTDNQSDSRASEIAREVKAIMKTMRFNCKKQPSQSDKGIYRQTYRCSRKIGSNDIL